VAPPFFERTTDTYPHSWVRLCQLIANSRPKTQIGTGTLSRNPVGHIASTPDCIGKEIKRSYCVLHPRSPATSPPGPFDTARPETHHKRQPPANQACDETQIAMVAFRTPPALTVPSPGAVGVYALFAIENRLRCPATRLALALIEHSGRIEIPLKCECAGATSLNIFACKKSF
jgi:hypothetical protein